MINTQHWKASAFQHSQQWKHEERLSTHLKDLKKSQNYLSLHLSPKQDCNTNRNRARWEEGWAQLQCLQEQSHYTPHTLLTSQEALALSWAHEEYSSTLRCFLKCHDLQSSGSHGTLLAQCCSAGSCCTKAPSKHTPQQSASPNHHALKHTAMEQLLPRAQLLSCNPQTGKSKV